MRAFTIYRPEEKLEDVLNGEIVGRKFWTPTQIFYDVLGIGGFVLLSMFFALRGDIVAAGMIALLGLIIYSLITTFAVTIHVVNEGLRIRKFLFLHLVLWEEISSFHVEGGLSARIAGSRCTLRYGDDGRDFCLLRPETREYHRLVSYIGKKIAA